jgi:outer membrane protein assembly factor BamB
VSATTETNNAPSTAARPLFPRGAAKYLIGGSLLMVLVLRFLARMSDAPAPFNNQANINVATLIFSFIAAATAWFWFSFRSGYAPLARRLALVSAPLLVLVFAATFRLKEVDGNMLPHFVPRWTPVHDRQLGAVEPVGAVGEIDLATTTPDDFPQFLGPERNGWLPGPKLARDWTAAPPKLLWKRPIGAGWSAFAAVNGYAVTLEQRGDEEWLSCYEIDSGKPVWGHATRARHENPLGGIGPRSTPTIHEGRVYALGATGVLRCLDGSSGALVWQEDLLNRYDMKQAGFEAMVSWGRAGSPLIVDDLVIVPGGGKPGKAKTLAAFRADSGELVWEAENQIADDGTTDQIAYASPALATLAGVRQVVIVNESTASGHDVATGERLWSHPWPGHSNMDASSSQAVPIDGDLLLLTKGYGGGAEMLLLSNVDGQLQAETDWKNRRVLQTKFSNVVVYDDFAFGLSEGILECVELDSGERRWKRGRFGHGQILGVGDLLLVLAEDGRLALVELNSERFVELGSIQALEGKTWNTLCLYGHKLLIRNGQEAACYELP